MPNDCKGCNDEDWYDNVTSTWVPYSCTCGAGDKWSVKSQENQKGGK
jgi:hypothetical protein